MNGDQLFYTDPNRCKFKLTQEQEFCEVLKDHENHTILEPIDSAREVTLDETGKTQSGDFRFTSWAFYQLCHTVCPGMFRFLMELSGRDRKPEAYRGDYSRSQALDIFNQVVRRRFASRLADRMALRNTLTNTIDGVVGPKYRWLSNHLLYEQTKEILSGSESDLEFYEANLIGRWLLLRFYKKTPWLDLTSPNIEKDRFFLGFHFSNSEAGQSSAKAGLMLLRDQGRTASISPLVSQARLRHCGKDFDKRLMAMISTLSIDVPEPEYLEERFAALSRENLGLGNDDVETEELRQEDLVVGLIRCKVSPLIAKRILGSTIVQDSYGDSQAKPTLLKEAAQARTAFDFYNAMGRVARKLSIHHREQVEQVAYKLLIGKFQVTIH